MIVRIASPLYSGAGCMARLSYLASWSQLVRWYALCNRRAFLSLGCCQRARLAVAWFFPNELATIHEYLTQHVLSTLSSVGEHAPVSLPASHVVSSWKVYRTIHSDFMLFKVTCAVFNICLGLVDLVFYA